MRPQTREGYVPSADTGARATTFHCWSSLTSVGVILEWNIMISRHWTGVARRDCEAAYEAHLIDDTFPAIRQIEGFVDASILKRPVANGIEFLIVTRWKSMDAIAKFAGEDAEAAVVPTKVRKMMVEFDTRVRHYEVVAL